MKPEYFFLLFLLLGGCVAANTRSALEATEHNRPERGYIHWLEKQAMYNQASHLLAQVSQSERMWLNASAPDRASILLQTAPNWLDIQAGDFASQLFARLARSIGSLPQIGITGLYLGEINETSELWQKNSKPRIVSLELSPDAGDAKAFENLSRSAESAGIELGSDLLGSATGMGPDFMLQTRNAPGSKGIYAMLEAPAEIWSKLPPAKKEMDALPISKNELRPLADASLIPESLARDHQNWSAASGWAVTGEVSGIDGKTRRWLYRYSEDAHAPVFMWQDPFGQAKRILSAAVIKQTGLQGQTLTGLHLEALMGLDPATADNPGINNFSPGLEALNDLASQIHRYGGWAMQADTMPPDIILKILNGVCDFCRDDATKIAALAGLLSGQNASIIKLYENWLKETLDFSRMARGLGEDEVLPIRIARAMPETDKILSETDDNTTLESLLAKSGISPTEAKKFLLNLKSGLPGLVFYSAEELNAPFTDAKTQETKNFSLVEMLEQRRRHNLAEGRIVKLYKEGRDGLGILSKLPEGGYWLLAMNFGKKNISLSGFLPEKSAACETIASTSQCDISERKFQVALDGTQCLNVIFF